MASKRQKRLPRHFSIDTDTGDVLATDSTNCHVHRFGQDQVRLILGLNKALHTGAFNVTCDVMPGGYNTFQHLWGLDSFNAYGPYSSLFGVPLGTADLFPHNGPDALEGPSTSAAMGSTLLEIWDMGMEPPSGSDLTPLPATASKATSCNLAAPSTSTQDKPTVSADGPTKVTEKLPRTTEASTSEDQDVSMGDMEAAANFMESRSPSASDQPRTTQGSSASTPNSLNELLSYPTPSEVSIPLASSSSSSAQPRPILKERLYVGNLHPTVDEYALLQLFSKFGKISKLDYLFHKSGPLKGKPRGYAFVEFANKDDAEKALLHVNNKLIRGRKLVVTYANQAPLDVTSAQGLASKSRRPVSDVGKPTTLSLLKSAGAGRSDATDAKIARMEAKLRQLESVGEGPGAGSSLPSHPSLPPKPVGAPNIPEPRRTPASAAPSSFNSRETKRVSPLPILPLRPSAQLPQKPATIPLVKPTSTPSPPRMAPTRKSALSGVRIMKPKTDSSSG
ncbi:hypothetical protein BD414DRAFT_578105 [Trametes punicea]|nr:hypothetical protein BD414DRAFT_578105 [Trametes punicea]